MAVFMTGTYDRRVEGVLLRKVAYNIYAPVDNSEIHFVHRIRNAGDWVIRIGEVESVSFPRLMDVVTTAKPLFDL